jgi:ribosomal protein L7Ae-like RNA K-turn-binding protein
VTETRAGPKASEALRLLGLARKAGAVVSGTDAARRAIRSREARLVLMAVDASSVQLDKVRSALEHRPIPWGILGDRATLGAAVGRAPVSAVAVTAASFAGPLSELLGVAERSVVNGAED